EARMHRLRGSNIVESDDRDVARHMPPGIVQGGDGSDGRGIVEGEERGEMYAAREQLLCSRESRFAAGGCAFELYCQFRIHAQPQRRTDAANRVPTNAGVGAEGLALDEGDAAVPQVVQVPQGERHRGEVVDLDTGNVIPAAVAGDRDHGNPQLLEHGRVDRNDAFDRPGEQQARVGLQQVRAVAVADDEVEELLLQERVFDAAEHGGRVSLTDLRDHDADGEAAPLAQSACKG